MEEPSRVNDGGYVVALFYAWNASLAAVCVRVCVSLSFGPLSLLSFP